MPNPFMKLLTLLAIVFLFLSPVKATHVSGGDISYDCIGQDSFLVTLTLFRDCGGSSLGNSVNVNFTSTCGGNFSQNFARQTISEVSAMCPTQISNSTCNGGALAGLEKHLYSGIVVLNPACNTWTLSWSLCCRNNLISNLTNPGSLDTYLYTHLNSLAFGCNNSARFNSDIFPSTCLNKSVDYNFGALDPDGDSLVYFLSPGYETATSLVPYSSTYTFTQPISGANAILDATNGQFTFNPTTVGVFVVVVRVEEYDRITSVKKGYVIRDIQITVTNCSNNSPETSLGGIYNYTGDGVRVDSNTINVCNGDSFSFDYSFIDSDTLDSMTVTHNIYQALDSTAIVSISGTNPIVINVTWVVNENIPERNILLRAKDDQCPFPGVSYGAIKLSVKPRTLAGQDQAICAGTQWANLQVEGGSAFTWTTISGSAIDTIPTSPNFNMTCWHCDNPSVRPQVTTTYVVYSNLISNCGAIDTVTVNVVPDFTLTLPPDTILCPPFMMSLIANTSNNALSYSYVWNTGNAGDTLQSLNISLQESKNFNVTVASSQGCEKVESTQVDLLKTLPVGANIQGDTVLCTGENGNLELFLGEPIGSSCGISTQSCIGTVISGVIGAGTTQTLPTSFPAPYGRFYWGVKHQMLFTAAEMHAMGMLNGGKITAISFDVAAVGTALNFNNFEIKLGCTNSSDLSAGWETGLVTVLPGYTHLVTSGWNQHTFTDAYNWNGISNVVVEICYHNSAWSSAESALTYYTPTSFKSVRYYRADNATVCSNTSTTGTSFDRPNIKFDYCSGFDENMIDYLWSPTASIDSVNILTPTVSSMVTTNYQVIIQDTGGHCADTLYHQVEVVSEFDAGFYHESPYCLTAAANNLVPKVGGGVFTGAGVNAAGVFTPAIAGVGNWPINYTIPLPVACASDSIIIVEVIGLPDASFTPIEVCMGGSQETLVAATPGGIWAGTGISDSLIGIFDSWGLPTGEYEIIYTLYSPCYSADTQMIRIIEPYYFGFNSYMFELCEGDTLQLANRYTMSSSAGQGSGPVRAIWSDIDEYVDSNGVFNALNVPPGDYVVNLSIEGTDGLCGSIQSCLVRVNAIGYPELIENDICINQASAKLFVNPWMFGTGLTFSQNPLSPLGPNDTLMITPFGQNGQFTPSLRGVGHWELNLTWVNSFGCTGTTVDTIHVLNPPDTAVDYLGTTLISKAGMGYQYQWVDCNDNRSPITGATNASFTPTVQGNYAVEISAGTCSDQSGCFLTWPLGIDNSEIDLGIQIYPNPVTELLQIDLGTHQNITIEILDAKGKTVYSQESTNKISTVDMRNLPAGMYLIKLITDSGVQTQRIMNM